MKILIADDDKISRFMLRVILQGEPGYEVIEVESGDEAWAMLVKGTRPDLCILDMRMPGLSGLDLLRRVRADERFKHLRIILCSATNDRTTITQAAALSINYYILKPFRKELILQQVRKVAASLATEELPEDPALVCTRLGIELDLYQSLRQMLAAEFHEVIKAARQALERQDLVTASARLDTLKSASANLGLTGLSIRLTKLEAMLSQGVEEEGSVGEADQEIAFKAWSMTHGQAFFSALEELEIEGAKLEQPPATNSPAIPSRD